MALGEPEVLDGVAVARLSPDGSRLVRLDRGICVADTGAEVHPDTPTAQWSPDDAAAPGSRFDVRPSWSPDGSEIWFARATGTRGGSS